MNALWPLPPLDARLVGLWSDIHAPAHHANLFFRREFYSRGRDWPCRAGKRKGAVVNGHGPAMMEIFRHSNLLVGFWVELFSSPGGRAIGEF